MSADRDCKAFETELALFVGGELDSRTHTAVRAHVALCPACEAAVGRLHDAREALRAGSDLSELRPPDLWPALRARLLEEGAIRAPLAPLAERNERVPARRKQPRWIPLSAAAALVLAIGLWIGQQQNSDPTPPIAKGGTHRTVATPVGLRRLAPSESALSDSATTTEELQDEARRLWNPGQSGNVRAASALHPFEH